MISRERIYQTNLQFVMSMGEKHEKFEVKINLKIRKKCVAPDQD